MDLKEIKQIIDLMKKSELTEFAVEEENFKLKIRRAGTQQEVVTSVPAPAAPHAVSALHPSAHLPEPAPDEPGIAYITSPMVGTFYTAATPESPAFTEVNQKVEESTIVCIIEAMKIMNEIQAEASGIILESLVDNGQPVEFGQRLFKIRSS